MKQNNKQDNWEKKFDNTIGLGFDQTDEDTQDFYKDIKQFIQQALKNQEKRLYKLEEIRCQEAVQAEKEKVVAIVESDLSYYKSGLDSGVVNKVAYQASITTLETLLDTLNQ